MRLFVIGPDARLVILRYHRAPLSAQHRLEQRWEGGYGGPHRPLPCTAIRSRWPAVSPVRRNIMFSPHLCSGWVAATGQTTRLKPALPTIVAELGSTADQSWAVTSYLLGNCRGCGGWQASVICSAATGVPPGPVARRWVCAVRVIADDDHAGAISRALQGVGAGAISVTAYAGRWRWSHSDRGSLPASLGAQFGKSTRSPDRLGLAHRLSELAVRAF